MVINYYNLVKEKILKQIDSDEYQQAYAGKEQGKVDKNHFLNVVNITEELWSLHEDSKIPVALKIAALCHDVDRIYPFEEVNTKDYPEGKYTYIKGVHSGTAALLFLLNHFYRLSLHLK